MGEATSYSVKFLKLLKWYFHNPEIQTDAQLAQNPIIINKKW